MAIAGIGTVFNRWDDSGSVGVWSPIAEINSINGPGMSRNTIDTSALDTEGGYATFITGLRNAGTLSLSMNFTPEGYEAMKADFESDTAKSYQIILPDTTEFTFEFDGLVTELPLVISPTEKITMDVVIQISGPVETGSGGSV